jgi:hypothetical protein
MGMLRIKLISLLIAAGLCAVAGTAMLIFLPRLWLYASAGLSGAVICYVAAVHLANIMLYGPNRKKPPGEGRLG